MEWENNKSHLEGNILPDVDAQLEALTTQMIEVVERLVQLKQSMRLWENKAYLFLVVIEESLAMPMQGFIDISFWCNHYQR